MNKKLVFYAFIGDAGAGDENIVAISAMENGELLYDDDMVYDNIEKYASIVNPCELQEGYYETVEALANASIEEIRLALLNLGLEECLKLKELAEDDF